MHSELREQDARREAERQARRAAETAREERLAAEKERPLAAPATRLLRVRQPPWSLRGHGPAGGPWLPW